MIASRRAPLSIASIVLCAACSSSAASPSPGASSQPTEVVTAGGCAAHAASASIDAGDATEDGPALGALALATGALVPPFDPDVTEYTATTLDALHPIAVTAAADDDGTAITINGQAASSGVASSITLSPCEDVVITARAASGASRTYTIHYWPSDVPTYATRTSGAAGAEPVMLTPNSAYLLVVDRAGLPLYYRSFAPQIVANLQRHALDDGSVGFSAFVGVSHSSYGLGAYHMMDASLHDLGDAALLPNRAHGALPAEEHDFVWLGDQHYIAESYVTRTVDLGALDPAWSDEAGVLAPIVQEVDHGVVKLEWDAGDFPSLYSDSISNNMFDDHSTSDYLHLNSIDVDPKDGNVILSLRHASEIVKIDRKTGQPLWTLGGAEDSFGLTSDQRFAFQHHVRAQADGSLMVFDNGNGAHQTRVIKFVLDEAARRVTSFSVVYTRPSDEPPSIFMGSSVQLDATRYVIGWGGWATVATAPPSVTEIVDGAPVWSLTFDDPATQSYRALPIPLR